MVVPDHSLRLLVVDDDPKLRSYLRQGIEENGIECHVAADAEQALAALRQETAFDLVLLDVMMPGRSGWDLLAELRSGGDETPVIFLTARNAVDERVKGLRLGADDYIIKPFAFSELMARIDAVVRRRRPERTLQIEDLGIDLDERRAWRGSRSIETSPREFELLRTLAEAQGQVLSRSQLLRSVWGIDFDTGTNVVEVLVARLRRKLDCSGTALLRTVPGEGYRLGPGATDLADTGQGDEEVSA
jgi:two-component system copper resistance phosphate regulon response regulator CusR